MKNFLPKQYKLDSKIKLNHSYLVEQFSDYSKIFKNGFVLEPYAGVSYNNTLSNDVTIIADEENK